MPKQFTHLHTHSIGSMLDGMATVANLVKKAKSLNMTALAITNHGNLFDAINFYTEAQKAGIKPIQGVEFNFVEDCTESKSAKLRQTSHITILAENNIGWRNLIHLVSESNKGDCYYYKPRIDFKLLEKYKEGLIILTGCSGGIISKYLHNQDGNKSVLRAEALLRRLMQLFDVNHLYLEVQDHHSDIEKELITELRKLATKYGLKTVATNNVHYIDKDDYHAHATLLNIAETMHTRYSYSNFDCSDYGLKTREEMEALSLTEDELNLTSEIADRCNVEINLKKKRLPSYNKFLPEGIGSKDYLYQLVTVSAIQKGLDIKALYLERINKELSDIDSMGFNDYFLIVWDVIQWCRNNNIFLGPGRGSVGGSLVAYLLGITDIDPIKYNLIWERFLNKGRGGLPDIDTDIQRSKRGLVLQYIKDRFGSDTVAQLPTFSKLAARAVLKDVFRVFGLGFEESNQITNLVPMKNDDHTQISLDEAIKKVPELAAYEVKYKSWFAIARQIEGCYKSLGTHASAVVIADTPFSEGEYPTCKSSDEESIVCGWDMGTVDKLNLLKQDVLGLNTLDVLDDAFRLIKERHGVALNMQSIPLKDQATFDLISLGRTIGVFQLESQLGRSWCRKLTPQSIEEVSDLIALIRPATLDTGMTKKYYETKTGQIPYTPVHPLLDSVVKPTYGILCFQEQTIRAFKELASFTLEECDLIRRAIGKKHPEELKAFKTKFIDGCLKNNILQVDSDAIWDSIEQAAGYQFNLSHSIGYALLSYYTAYLKANFPVEFFCAQLNNSQFSQDALEEIQKFVNDAKLFDIKVLPPSIKSGNLNFMIQDDTTIAFGLSCLKGIGEKTLSKLVKTITGTLLNSYDEFLWALVSAGLNVKVVEALIKSGAFDSFDMPRCRMWAKYVLLSELTTIEQKQLKILVDNNVSKNWVQHLRAMCHETEYIALKEQIKVPNVARRATIRELLNMFDASDPFDGPIEKIGWEKYYLGIPLTGSETDLFKSKDKCKDIIKTFSAGYPIDTIIQIVSVRQIKTKKNDDMAFITGGDHTCQLDNIVIFPQTFNKYKMHLSEGNILRLKGKLDTSGSIIVDVAERLK